MTALELGVVLLAQQVEVHTARTFSRTPIGRQFYAFSTLFLAKNPSVYGSFYLSTLFSEVYGGGASAQSWLLIFFPQFSLANLVVASSRENFQIRIL